MTQNTYRKYRALTLMIRFTRNGTWLEAGTLNLMLLRSALNLPIYLRILLGKGVHLTSQFI